MEIEDFMVIGGFFVVLLIILLPVVVILYAGIIVANNLGLVGFEWWICVILFYLIVGGILGALDRIGR